MNKITESLLRVVSDFGGTFKGAYNVREDGGCAGRQSSEHIKLESKKDGPGLIIRVAPGTKGETVYIPACVTHGGIDDLVYNDFYIGEGADVVVVAGCGVHNEDDTVYHLEDTLHLASEIRVSGGIDDIDLDSLIVNGSVFGQDGDAALALDIIGVHDTLRDLLVFAEYPALF